MNPAIKLSDLLLQVQEILTDQFYGEEFFVVAETSDIKNYPDRSYCFVTLVEKEGAKTTAKAEAVIWSKNYHIISHFEAASGVKFDKNIKVLLKVIVDYSPVWGLKLQILDIDASFTLGNLELQRQQIIKSLVINYPQIIREVEGELISFNKRLIRPVIFKRIAIISAPGSDGLRDFTHELNHNERGHHFIIKEYLCQIQGNGAAQQIISQLQQIRTDSIGFDAVVGTRGGGSQVDFGPCVTLELAVEIAGYPLPVITGIGHERNVSIADMVSHLNLKTPTKAAAFLINHNRKAEEDAEQYAATVLIKARQRFVNEDIKLGQLNENILRSAIRFLKNQHTKLERLQQNIRHLDPARILARGFAMIMKNENIISSSEDLMEGESLKIILHDGTVNAEVTQKNTSE